MAKLGGNMSTFTLNSITVQGLNIIAKLVAGSQLEFTRIAVGDGAMPSDKTPLTVTDLTHKLFDVDINSVVNNDNGSATVKGVFSNTASETGFFYRELGLFAKDPDTKKEILYCYGNAAADAEWISPAGSSSVIEKEVSIITLIGNAEKITVSLKSGIYTTKEDLDNLLDFRHQSTDYKVGDKVLCEYNCMLFLECTKAGTTDNNILNTRGFIHGQVVHDGTVEWTVRTNIKSINNLKADSNGNVAINDFLEKTGGTVTGNLNASGYNITATKFIGNLQGKADSATNADLATKANQDSQGQTINTTYVKGITASNATLTLTKGNGTTSTVTINNVGNSTKATQDSQGQAINTTYIKSITASNATLTLTKGNGTTSTVTINNVANSAKATQDGDGNVINTTYLKRSGGTITGDITIDTSSERKFVGSGINAGIYFNSTGMGFYDWENSRHVFHYIQDQNLVEIQSTFTAPTPISSDNSNTVATTAFVKSLFTASKQQNGWWKDTNTGFLYQWGSLTASTESETYYMYGEATFPLTFSTVFQAVVCHDGFTPTGSCVNGLSNSQIKVKLGVYGVTPQNTPWTCRYLAVGLA